jgi:hypothetical protein
VLSKQLEGINNVTLRKIWTVTADNYDFLVTDPCQMFDGVVKPLTKRSSRLLVNLAGRRDHTMGAMRREEVNVTPCSLSEAKALRFQEDAECTGPATPLAVGVGRIGENEQSPLFH